MNFVSKWANNIGHELEKGVDTVKNAADDVTHELEKGVNTVKHVAEDIGNEVVKGANTTADVVKGDRSIRSVVADIPNEVTKAATSLNNAAEAVSHERTKAGETMVNVYEDINHELQKGGLQNFLEEAGELIMNDIGEELCAAMKSLKDAVGEALTQAKAKIVELLAKYAGKLTEMATRVYKQMKPVIELAMQLLKALKQHGGMDKFVADLTALVRHSLLDANSAKSNSSVQELIESLGSHAVMGSLIDEFKKNMEEFTKASLTSGTFGIGPCFGGAAGVDIGGNIAVCIGLDDAKNTSTKPEAPVLERSVIIGAGLGLEVGVEADVGLNLILSKNAPAEMGGPGIDCSVMFAAEFGVEFAVNFSISDKFVLGGCTIALLGGVGVGALAVKPTYTHCIEV